MAYKTCNMYRTCTNSNTCVMLSKMKARWSVRVGPWPSRPRATRVSPPLLSEKHAARVIPTPRHKGWKRPGRAVQSSERSASEPPCCLTGFGKNVIYRRGLRAGASCRGLSKGEGVMYGSQCPPLFAELGLREGIEKAEDCGHGFTRIPLGDEIRHVA